MSERRWLGVLRPALILAVGWVVFVLYAYPGLMTMDSFDQLREGREFFFTDAHPPVMAALWGIVDRIVAGPFGMLLIQSTAFLAGVYLILCRAMRPWVAAICASVLLLFPPILAPLAVIWKDCLMAGLLVLGIPAVLASRRWMKLVGLGLFVLATAVRYNALAATLPLIVLLLDWAPRKRVYVRYVIASGAWVTVVVLAMGLNSVLTNRQLHYWYASSALADISGVLAKIDHDIPDDQLRPLLAPTEIKVDTNIHAAVRAKYKPYDFQQLITGEGQLWVVPSATEVVPEARREAIGHAWREIVLGNLGAYTRYRFDVFAETLGLRHKFQGATVILHRVQYAGMLDAMGLPGGTSGFQEVAESATMWTAKRTRLFRPHVYLFLSLGLLLLCRRNRDVFAIVLSGVAMELSMLVLGWTADFRFSHWLVTCSCIGLIMLIARRVRVVRRTKKR